MEQDETMMTAAEVAEMLRVDRSTLWRWRKQGVGPAPIYLRPRVPRYRRAEVLAFIKAQGAERGQ